MSVLIFANNSRSKQNEKKIPSPFLLTLVSGKGVQNFSKKYSNFTVVGARLSFPFFRQNTWFLENNGASSNFYFT